MTSTDTTQTRSRPTRLVWPLVVLAALAISWWSLYTLAHTQYGMPSYLAAVVSTVYDGGALVLADLSQRYARSQDSGAGPRFLMLALIGVSAWLNYRHATMLHYSLPGQVMFSSPPVVAGALFEIEQRFTHREALRAFGRVAPALPAFGRYAWLLHPARTAHRVWLITASRVDSVPVTVMDIYPAAAPVQDAPEPTAPAAAPEQEDAPEPGAVPAQRTEPNPSAVALENAVARLILARPPEWQSLTIQAAIERADAIVPDGPKTPRELVEILSHVGVETTEAYVRTVRQRVRAREADTEVIELRRPETASATA